MTRGERFALGMVTMGLVGPILEASDADGAYEISATLIQVLAMIFVGMWLCVTDGKKHGTTADPER